MALTGAHAPGATPLDEEQLRGLKVQFVTTHGELNALEQKNILAARLWSRSARSIVMPDMLSRGFIEMLHNRMYGEVWKWAGQQRTVETNIGVSYPRIGVELKNLFDDARYWLDHSTYEPVEFAVRLHHRLVWIHPFPNGNGRHARFYADLALTHHFKLERLTWGSAGELDNADPRRSEYIEALRAADQHDYRALLAFATS